jgi:hypothetical protein
MNRIPGFTAGEKVDKTNRRYPSSAVFGQTSGFLRPAQSGVTVGDGGDGNGGGGPPFMFPPCPGGDVDTCLRRCASSCGGTDITNSCYFLCGFYCRFLMSSLIAVERLPVDAALLGDPGSVGGERIRHH